MVHETLMYKGIEIKFVEKEDEEYFSGCYVRTIWFPDIVKAHDFVDRMTVCQDMDFR